MADREVSWSDAEEEVPVQQPMQTNNNNASVSESTNQEAPQPSEETKKSPKKTSKPKKERDIPEWEIDTKGDYEGSLPSSNERNTQEAAPEWPSEDSQLPPLTRRPGRDTPASNSKRESGKTTSNASGNNGKRTSGGDRNRRLFEEINLPGVDLSKMPAATTKLAYDDLRSGADASEERKGSKPSKRREIAPREETNWAASEWTSAETTTATGNEISQPVEPQVKETITTTARLEELDDRNLSWGDEPAEAVIAVISNDSTKVAEPVSQAVEPVAQSIEAKTSAKKSPKKSPKKKNEDKSTAVAAVAERLDSLGWGDEDEKSEKPAVIEKIETVKNEKVVEAVKSEKPTEQANQPTQPMQLPSMQSIPSMAPISPLAHMSHQMQPMPMPMQMPMPVQMSQPGSPVMCMPQTAFTTVLVGCPFCYQSFYYPIMMPVPAGQIPAQIPPQTTTQMPPQPLNQ